jgi:hypothetical protein
MLTNNKSRASLIRLLARAPLLCAVVLAAGGCVTSPPVQEMSDARQAIAAAEQADAARLSPETLGDARRLLQTAEQQLLDEAYGSARMNAVRARNRAVQALSFSQGAADNAN